MPNYDDIVSVFGKRNIAVVPVRNRSEAAGRIIGMIPNGSKVGYSGSVSLEQTGVLDRLRKGDYVLYDRSKVAKGSREAEEIGRLAQHADFFLSGANAITRDGKIVNIDMIGNRVSAQLYGPGQVILVVGRNKIVDNADAAIKRIKTVAAPLNAKRLGKNTPCAKTGVCADCSSPERICCSTVIIERQAKPGRITVLLVDEELGL